MSNTSIALSGFGAMLGLIAMRMPIGLSMLVVGSIGYIAVHPSGIVAFLAYMKTNPYHQFANYTLSVIPLFILMGALAERAGISTALFRASAVFVGHLRGGLAMAVIGACTAFGAICGSSVATTATFGRAAFPELNKLKYDGGFSTGTIAVGGTLGHSDPAVGYSRRVRHFDRAKYCQIVCGGADPRPAGGGVLLHCDRSDR